MVKADDEKATSPGDTLRTLLIEYGPCLILIDEWVAYARQLHDTNDLPAGTFDTQFTFAQALTESVKLAGNSLVVISLPASDTGSSPTPRRMTWKWEASGAGKPWIASGMWSGVWSRPGGRRAPTRALR